MTVRSACTRRQPPRPSRRRPRWARRPRRPVRPRERLDDRRGRRPEPATAADARGCRRRPGPRRPGRRRRPWRHPPARRRRAASPGGVRLLRDEHARRPGRLVGPVRPRRTGRHRRCCRLRRAARHARRRPGQDVGALDGKRARGPRHEGALGQRARSGALGRADLVSCVGGAHRALTFRARRRRTRLPRRGSRSRARTGRPRSTAALRRCPTSRGPARPSSSLLTWRPASAARPGTQRLGEGLLRRPPRGERLQRQLAPSGETRSRKCGVRARTAASRSMATTSSRSRRSPRHVAAPAEAQNVVRGRPAHHGSDDAASGRAGYGGAQIRAGLTLRTPGARRRCSSRRWRPPCDP